MTDRRLAIAVGATAVALGQLLLVLVGPLGRASSPGVEAVSFALLAPDSVTYLKLAASSGWLSETPWNRILYIALLRLGGTFGQAATAVVVLQALAMSAAAALAHRTATDVAGRTAGAVAAVVVAANPLTAQWVRFVLTESLFFALVVAVVWAGHRLLRAQGGRTDVTVLLGSALLATLLRPNGVLLLGSVLTLVLLQRSASWRTAGRFAGVLGVWIAIAGGLALGLASAGQPAERSITEQLQAGIVVEGLDHVLVTITMPAAERPGDTSMTAAARYVVAHPLATARLAVTRVAVEVAQVRRHYPTPVNAAIGLAMAVLLVTAGIGAATAGAGALRRVVVVTALPILLLVGATFATPEGRYGWGALIALAPLAGIGSATILRRAVPGSHGAGAGPAPGPQCDPGPGTAR